MPFSQDFIFFSVIPAFGNDSNLDTSDLVVVWENERCEYFGMKNRADAPETPILR